MFRALWKMLFPRYAGRQYDTVRYAFPLVIITALFASLASGIPENSSYVTVRTDAETVTKDQRFTIDVSIITHVPVNAVDLVIAYPEDKIVVDSVDTGTSVVTLWAEKPYAENGSIYIRGGTFRKGFLGEHTIARIRAHAIESGEARILIKDTRLVASDGFGTDVAITKSAKYNVAKIYVAGQDGVISAKASISVVTDADGDGDVDVMDIKAFMSAWFLKDYTFDFNGDGKMDIYDFSILLADSFFK